VAKEASLNQVRTRDADATRLRILEAAKKEFATFGLGGARVDRIADRARANKRMIYHYFSSKDALFTAVLEEAYLNIRDAERKLDLDKLEPEDALDALVTFTWKYYLNNPEFLTLVNSENLHKSRHLKNSGISNLEYPRFIEITQIIIDRGIHKGKFRTGVDPVQLNITIAAINYYYLNNQHTWSIIHNRDLMAKANLEARLAFNIQTIRRLVFSDPDP
jgi:AcrR family transcriptional regulator